MTSTLRRSDAFPPSTTKAHHLLVTLLNGIEVDTFYSLLNFNLATPNARVAELRKMGWPIRSLTRPHPRLEGETIVVRGM